MAKAVHSVPFDYAQEIDRFLNQHSIPKSDVISIRHHWNMGYYVFVLTFYAEESLHPAIKVQQEKFNKHYQRTYLTLLTIVGLLLLATLVYQFLRG